MSDLDTVYLWFAENGNIRKWSREPFEEGTRYVAQDSSEREAVVRWLRTEAEPLSIVGDKRHILLHVADAIERGEHL